MQSSHEISVVLFYTNTNAAIQSSIASTAGICICRLGAMLLSLNAKRFLTAIASDSSRISSEQDVFTASLCAPLWKSSVSRARESGFAPPD
jgi:hypothetical protein